MIATNYSLIERAILTRTQEVLLEFLPRFEVVDLSFQAPTLDIESDEAGGRTSELRIYFVRRGDVIDAIEFHIFENGRQLVDEEIVAEWLKENLADVLARATGGE